MTRLDVLNLSLIRGQKMLVKDFSYCFTGGLVYALLGNNGAGKTTLLKTLAGLLTLEFNQVLIDGQDLRSMHEGERARIISFLLQHSPEQPYCTAISRITHGLMPILGFNFSPDQKSMALIEQVAQRLNIQHLLRRRLRDLSGGEQRLVHLAKCLINPNVRILLLDEPSVFLDFSQAHRLGHYLREMAHFGKIIIFASHDAAFIENYSDRAIKIGPASKHFVMASPEGVAIQ
ncbi:MAG TPA: ABC transporter ATP-binding protein [Myxococcota bacterium]|nr:ABC transporter ATP-binding protein [Myxococcota bacterium]